MKVLLVDDSKTVCAIYSGLLSDHGYTVLVAYSMDEALSVAREHRPPLAIIDFYMPGGNGDELTQALHQEPTTASTVVAIHSQFPDVVKKALAAGAVELIGKDDPQDLFLMRVDALKSMVQAQTYQRNIEQLIEGKDLDDQPITVLLVDDSATIRAVYGNLLRQEGFKVLEANTVQSGRDMAQRELPDIMLIDFILSDGHGDELVRTLLGQVDTSSILMVMFSNQANLEDAALSAGAIDIASKDDPDEVFIRRVHSMRRYVESQRKQRQVVQESKNEITQLLERAEQAREAADEANRAKDDFLASMSHELRTPLTSIIGNSEMLAQSTLNTEQHKMLQAVDVSGRNLLSLVNDILDLSKIGAGKFEIDYAPYNLSRLLKEIQQIFSTRARDSGLDFTIKQQTQPTAKIWGDGKRIGQILINLLGNAVKFTEQGHVTLTVWQEEALYFSVQDSGIGMSESVLERLFQPFEQADSSISRRFGGTGLGLHISGSLAELMGGEISAQSEEGKGSCFTLKLPYKESDIEAAPLDTNRDDCNTSEKKLFTGHVLVAEDTPELQMLERRILESMGVKVTLANNGAEALDALEQQHFELVLMDMMMPVMDGLEATQALRARGNQTPVIALTANVMQKHRDQFTEAGAEGFLEKPIDKGQLQKVLQLYLKAEEDTPVLEAGTHRELNQQEINQLLTPEQHLQSTDQDEAKQSAYRLLMVDDEPSVLETYRMIFESQEQQTFDETTLLIDDSTPPSDDTPLEFQLTLADQGKTAVDLAHKALASGLPFQTAFIDMRMPPGMDGLQTAQALRALDPRIFIVIATAYSDINPKEIAQTLGSGVLYLNKPFNKEMVQQTARMFSQLWENYHGQNAPTQTANPTEQTGETPALDNLIDDELMALFRETSQEKINVLTTAIAKSDWAQVRLTAHSIKGSAATFGHPTLAETASKLQHVIDQEALTQAASLTDELLSGLQKALQN